MVRTSRTGDLWRPGSSGFQRSLVVLGLALLWAAGSAGSAGAESSEQVTIVEGKITGVSSAAIEVNGRRGAITDETFLMGDGRPIALGSVRKGRDATMDLDAAGRALQVDVHGVVE